MMEKSLEGPVREIVILGGGSSGWMSAAFLWKGLNGQIKITLVESLSIPTIGVGEASVPSIQPEFFDFLGIREEDWMRECNGAFKIGIKFVNWACSPERSEGDYFYHIFGESRICGGIPLTHYWIRKRLQGYETPLSYACYPSARICDAEKAPKYLDGRAAVPYAYHFDAGLLAEFLREWAMQRGVRRVQDDVIDVRLDERGDIESLVTAGGLVLAADLFLDCSGFSGRLINQALQEPFVSFQQNLLCDRAVAINTPYEEGKGPSLPYTTATAMSAGWAWKIPLANRYGNGYVYSSSFQEPEDAERELRRALGPGTESCAAKHLRMRIGRTRRPWVRNCVAIGLSSGFLEPLESTGIYCIYAALFQLLRYFPRQEIDPVLRDKFNERTAFMIDDIKDFIVLHYCTTSRTDTPFWRANREDLVVPETLRQDLEVYKTGVPIKLPYTGAENYNRLIFDASFDRFWTNSNYTAILSGMNVLPDREPSLLAYHPEAVELSERMLDSVAEETECLVRALPRQDEYIRRLNAGEIP